jgi:tRNA dimethylallyltransferase
MLDVADPKDRFSVVEYVKQADAAIGDILARNKLPIICGGTGFYIEALVDGKILPEVGANEELRRELSVFSTEELMTKLNERDPLRAADIDPKNKRRIIRALEIAETLGKVPPVESDPKYDPVFIGLSLDREVFIGKINTRLLSRIHSGMIDEAKKLNAEGLTFERMEELGLEYRYLAQFLQGEIREDELINELLNKIWQYSKRQMTWFKRDNRITWFEPKDREAIKEYVAVKLGL